MNTHVWLTLLCIAVLNICSSSSIYMAQYWKALLQYHLVRMIDSGLVQTIFNSTIVHDVLCNVIEYVGTPYLEGCKRALNRNLWKNAILHALSYEYKTGFLVHFCNFLSYYKSKRDFFFFFFFSLKKLLFLALKNEALISAFI